MPLRVICRDIFLFPFSRDETSFYDLDDKRRRDIREFARQGEGGLEKRHAEATFVHRKLKFQAAGNSAALFEDFTAGIVCRGKK